MTERREMRSDNTLEWIGCESPYRAANVLTSVDNKILLVGRARELNTLLRHIRNGRSTAVVGPRRIGKSLLVQIARDIIEGSAEHYLNRLIDHELARTVVARHSGLNGIICVSETLEGKTLTKKSISAWIIRACYKGLRATAATTGNKRLGAILAETRRALARSDELSLFEMEDEMDRLGAILDEAGKQLVIIIDEFERVFSSDEATGILSLFRTIIEYRPNISFVFVGTEIISDSVKEPSSPLANMLWPIQLGPISTRDVATLVRVPVQGLIDYEDSAFARIASLTGNNPYFVQVLCALLFERYAARAKQSSMPISCSANDIDRELSAGLLEELLDRIEVVLRDAHRQLSPSQQEIMIALAYHPKITRTQLVRLSKPTSDKDLDYLLSHDYIKVSDDHHYYVAAEINEIWLREKVAPARGEALPRARQQLSRAQRRISSFVTWLPLMFLVAFAFWYIWILPGVLRGTVSIGVWGWGDVAISYPRYVGWGETATIHVSAIANQPIAVSLQAEVPGIVITSGTLAWEVSTLQSWESKEIEFRYIGANTKSIETISFNVALQNAASHLTSKRFMLRVLPVSTSLLGRFTWAAILIFYGLHYSNRLLPVLSRLLKLLFSL